MSEDESNVISLDEWRRVQRQVNQMTLPELAITVHKLISIMIELVDRLEEKD